MNYWWLFVVTLLFLVFYLACLLDRKLFVEKLNGKFINLLNRDTLTNSCKQGWIEKRLVGEL